MKFECTPGGMTSLRVDTDVTPPVVKLVASSDGLYMFSLGSVDEIVELHRELGVALAKLVEFGLYSPKRGPLSS